MTAFPESGRSDRKVMGEIKVRFRPQAVIKSVVRFIGTEPLGRKQASESFSTMPERLRVVR